MWIDFSEDRTKFFYFIYTRIGFFWGGFRCGLIFQRIRTNVSPLIFWCIYVHEENGGLT